MQIKVSFEEPKDKCDIKYNSFVSELVGLIGTADVHVDRLENKNIIKERSADPKNECMCTSTLLGLLDQHVLLIYPRLLIWPYIW